MSVVFILSYWKLPDGVLLFLQLPPGGLFDPIYNISLIFAATS